MRPETPTKAELKARIAELEAEGQRIDADWVRRCQLLQDDRSRAEAELAKWKDMANAQAKDALDEVRSLEAEVALRDRMLRDIIERIALTPERWNGRTTEEVLADLKARAQEPSA